MTQLKIAGIDVSAGSVTVCVLSSVPEDLKRFTRKHKPLKFKADREGINGLLALDFDAAVMEPTGDYSQIWAHHIEQAGRLVKWVGHSEISHHRKSEKEINKSDAIDAIILACYGVEKWHHKGAFLDWHRDRIRTLYLQLEHLNRSKHPTVTRLRQQLSHELPELSEQSVQRKWLSQQPPGLWRAISGERLTPKWESVINDSIGMGISPFSQALAAQICQLERQEYSIEVEIDQEMQRPEYSAYLEIFSRYAIGPRTAAALLTVLHPIDRFLSEDGTMLIEHVTTDTGGRARRNRSLSAFKLACGLGTVRYQSGKVSEEKAAGPSHIRKALWRWCKIAIVIDPNLELEAIQELRRYYEKGSQQVKVVAIEAKPKKNETWLEREVINPKQARVTIHYGAGIRNQRVQRVVRRMLERLFFDLVKSL